MWIPTPIYERIPQCWLLLGLLFMSSGVYLSFDYELTFLYFGTGVFCVVWGARILLMRHVYRNKTQDESLESECVGCS